MSTVDQSWMSPVQKWDRVGFSFTWDLGPFRLLGPVAVRFLDLQIE